LCCQPATFVWKAAKAYRNRPRSATKLVGTAGTLRESTSSSTNPRNTPAPRRRPRIPPRRRRRRLRRLSIALSPILDNTLAVADPCCGHSSTRHRSTSVWSVMYSDSCPKTYPPSPPKLVTDLAPLRRAPTASVLPPQTSRVHMPATHPTSSPPWHPTRPNALPCNPTPRHRPCR